MTANNSFYPAGWSHIAPAFVIPIAHHPDGFDFAQVLRDANGHAFEVWFGGIGETFRSAAQAVHHIRLLARVVGNAENK